MTAATPPTSPTASGGTGVGTVASRITAGKHELTVDEPAALAEDDLDAARRFGKDETVRAGFGDVRLTRSETAERYEELRVAVDAHCPVLDLVQNLTPVTTTVEVSAS